jgi:hypothetical protein
MRFGVFKGSDEYRDAAAGERDEGSWMQHLRPIVRQLCGLAGVKLRNHAGVGHYPRICGKQARHVLPERHALRFQGSSEQSRGEVGPAPAECCQITAGCLPEKAGNDGYRPPCEDRCDRRQRVAVGGGEVGRSLPEGVIGGDDLQRVDVLGTCAGGIERRGHQARTQLLATRDELVQ